MVDDNISAGETVSAVLKNALTGTVQKIDKESKSKYKIEIKVTVLATGEIHRYEATR